jgi:hypothetical protein
MPSAIRIKRRDATGSTGAPAALLNGELAFNEADKTLYYGFGVTLGGAATNVISIGGEGAYFSKNIVQAANSVLAGPTDGTSAAPTFRGLVSDDIPSLTASKITNFDAQVQSNTLNSLTAAVADIDCGTQKLINVGAPVNATDAANKAYVDAARNGLDVKNSVRVATTANITLSGLQVIDGVSVLTENRVLVKNQSTAAENGIYVASSGAWSRSEDADSSTEVTPGMFTFVEEGSTNADSGWVLTNNATINLGITGLAFAQFSGAGQITAGAGLIKSGNTIDVVGTSNRITVNTDNIDIAASYVGQTSINTLGTVTTGTWNATTISIARGGTGLTAASKGSVLVANAENVLTALDGGGVHDGILTYDATTDTISWEQEIDGGVF